MKHLGLAAGLAALLSSGAAMGADINGSLKDGADVFSAPKSVNWTGFYIGGSLGYGNANHNLSVQRYNGGHCFDAFNNLGPAIQPKDATDGIDLIPGNEYALNKSGDGGIVQNAPESGNCSDLDKDFIQTGGGSTPLDTSDDTFAGSRYAPVDPSSKELGSLDGVNSHGLVGDGRVGFDFAHGRFLVGAFGSYGFSNMETSVNGTLGISGNGKALALDRVEKGDEWSVGLRAGLLVNPRTLLYVLAAYTQTDYEFSGVDFGGATPAKFAKETTFDGVTVGGGVEFALTRNIFLGIEGTHTFYDEETVLDTGGTEVGGFGQRLVDDLDETKVMGTLKIKLNGGLSDLTD